MVLFGDYHTHTKFSHGKGTVEENARTAREMGLKQIAITDHGLGHIAFGLRKCKLPHLARKSRKRLKNTAYKNIQGRRQT